MRKKKEAQKKHEKTNKVKNPVLKIYPLLKKEFTEILVELSLKKFEIFANLNKFIPNINLFLLGTVVKGM